MVATCNDNESESSQEQASLCLRDETSSDKEVTSEVLLRDYIYFKWI